MSTARRRPSARAGAVFFASILLFTLPFSHSIAARLLALLLAWGCVGFAWRELEVPRFRLIPLLGAWAALGALSLTWAIDLEYSASELKSEVLYAVLVYLLFYALSDVKRLERFRTVLLIATAASFVSAIYWAAFLTPTSTSAYFNGVGMYSTFLAMVYPFALIWALDPKQRWRVRLVNGLVVAGILGCVTLTLSRAAWLVLGLETALVLMLGASSILPRWNRRTHLAVLVGAIAVLGAVFFAVSKYRALPVQASAIGMIMDDARGPLWRFAVHRIAQDPFKGAGFGRGSMRKAIRSEFGHPHWEHAHNTVLNYGMSMGLWGIVLVLSLFGVVMARFLAIVRGPYPELRPYAIAGFALAAGLLLKLMFDDFFYRQTTLFYWAVAGMLLGAYERLRSAPERAPGALSRGPASDP